MTLRRAVHKVIEPAVREARGERGLLAEELYVLQHRIQLSYKKTEKEG